MSTDPVVAPSNILNAPIAALTPTEAQLRRDQLMADPNFQSRVAAKDPAAFEEATRLWRVSRGMTADPVPPATPEQVRERMLEKDLMLDDARLSTWERLAGMDDAQRFIESRRGLATKQQIEDAKAAIERMKSDSAFRVRVLNGDMDAKKRWLLAGRVATMQPVPE